MRTCADCGCEIWRRNKSGRCLACTRASPEYRARMSAAVKRTYTLRPEVAKAAADRLRAATAMPEHVQRAAAMMRDRKLWERGVEALGPAGSSVRQKAGKALSETRMAHIPRERRDEYRHLTASKGFSAAEAEAIIMADHERDMAAFRRKIGG